jgi:glycerophosphoryl diester phosphodiesterase
MINRGLLRTIDGRMSVIAHRRGRGTWRENILEAVAGARSMGADGIELDARLTRDGLVVVHHDDELDSGERIDHLRSDELPGRLPDLASVISACRDLLLSIEIKLDGAEPGRRPDAARCRALATGVAELLFRDPGRVIVSSFWPDALVSFGEAAAGIPTGLLVHPALNAQKTREAVASASNLGCSALHPFYLAATPALVELSHDAGLEVAVWTVNPPADIRGLEASGVDAVITDDVAGTLSSLGRGR